MGRHSVLGFSIVPPFGRGDVASLKRKISLYCPPSHVIYVYVIARAGVIFGIYFTSCRYSGG